MKQFLTIIFSFFIIGNSFSQDINQTLAFANEKYAEQNYNIALKSYKRVLFFDTAASYNIIHSKLADCYFYENDLENSLLHYDIAYNLEENDSLKNEYSFKRILIFTLQNNYSDASQEIYSLKDSLSLYFNKRKEFYLGIIDLQNDSIESSKAHFINALNSNDSIKTNTIKEAFSKVNLRKPNPKLAKYLSIIPGLGQTYSGNYKNAANAFLLSASLATLFLYIASNYTFIDATLSIFPYFQRYYIGGITKAEKGAIGKKFEKKNKLLSKLLFVFADNK